MMPLRELVFEALNNAVANGYSFDGWTVAEMAYDLHSFSSCLENTEPEELVPFIVEWKAKMA